MRSNADLPITQKGTFNAGQRVYKRKNMFLKQKKQTACNKSMTPNVYKGVI